jgi:hypothetical protein
MHLFVASKYISRCNISNKNHVESVLGLGESCNHETTNQGLSEAEITSIVPEAVTAKLNTEIADLKKNGRFYQTYYS